MRDLSSSSHLGATCDGDDRCVDIDDRLLPAAPHLTGPGAAAAVAPVVAVVGGELLSLVPGQVLYRPGRELIVSYGARVRWSGGREVEETILAGTTVDGPPAGTVAVEADRMSVGIWRYPFDPVLRGLAHAVVPGPAAALLDLDPSQVELDVRSFRPGRRAVVRVAWASGEAYVKVVDPARTAAVVDRHQALLDAGIPVPEVLAADTSLGLVAMRALPGTELRHRLIAEHGPTPGGAELLELSQAFAGVPVPEDGRPRPSLIAAAPRHARLVRRVLPEAEGPVTEVLELVALSAEEEPTATIHGDLHDAQIRVDDSGRIIGVLDVDDVGPGDQLDDPARVLAHLLALAVVHPPSADRVRRYAELVHGDLIERTDPGALHARVAAALVGLASGPFRTQAPRWREEGVRILELAHAVAMGGLDERTLRCAS